MKISEVYTCPTCLAEWKATKELCKDKKRSCKSLGASACASCKSQGFRPRDSKVWMDLDNDGEQEQIGNRTVKGAPYGGPTKNYSRG